jgi:hypothetical protein
MINEKALIENLSMDKELKQPKRYAAAGEGVVRTDEKGSLVLLSDYEKLLRFTAILDRHEEVQYKQREAFEKLAKELKAEAERLDTLCKQLMAQHSDISCENIMLRKAGDAMASTLMNGGITVSGYALAEEWFKAKLLAAKEGKAK